jgi:predicted nucleic acid-binding protein
MTLVDSGIWIDYFRGAKTIHTDHLDRLLSASEALVGDLILAEVLQGYRTGQEAITVESLFGRVPCITIAGRDCAIAAAENNSALRALGQTPRKTIDTLIAPRCILDGPTLLHADRDFDPFLRHLGLRVIEVG